MFLRASSSRSARIALAFAGSVLSSSAFAQGGPAFDLGEKGQAPAAYFNWCDKNLGNCSEDMASAESTIVILNERKKKILAYVNKWWNDNTIPTADIVSTKGRFIDLWRVANKGDKADCEDIMLAKRKTLIEQFGFERDALLMTLVRDPKGEGHAVLTVKTDKGYFVLDNRNNEVKLWNKTDLEFVSAMSRGMWRVITTPKQAPVNPVINVAWSSSPDALSPFGGAGRFSRPALRGSIHP